MKLLRRLVTYWSSRWTLLPDTQLSCAERTLEQLRHQAESLSRGRWL
ncbi:hypothetical protein ACFPAG_04360 [Vogesella sp. GCM10023246]|uniref:Transposase n=1 Tax=Vogesella oryzagri TaxID=3160864 RepID=A0ABV1M1B7_9NEIS